jgi:hypothetical protein
MVAKAEKKIKEKSAFERYLEGGTNFSSLIAAIEPLAAVPSSKATTDELTELLKKLCLSAQGSRWAINLREAELTFFAQFLAVACEKERTPESLLKALKSSPEDFRAASGVLISGFVTKAKDVVPKLVTHLQKTRNPDSKVEVYVDAPLDSSVWAMGTEDIARLVSVTDAQLVGQRWFWEATIRIGNKHRQWVDVIRLYENSEWFWKNGDIKNLPAPRTRFPSFVGSLSHQILFEKSGGGFVSLTPLTSIGGLSQLASSSGADLIWRQVKTAEYGGTNARNIAALMMDRSGQIRHPINAPWIAPKRSTSELHSFSSKPNRLVKRVWLPEKAISRLFEPHIGQSTNASRAKRLWNLIEPILEASCEPLLELRQHALDNNLAPQNRTDDIYSHWIYQLTPLNDKEYSKLAALILGKSLGKHQTRDFSRWDELVDVTKDWLKSV